MKKLILFSLLMVSLLIVGCAKEEMSNAELKYQLEGLSDEQLDLAIDTVETQGTGALAGQAHFRDLRVSNGFKKDKFLSHAYSEKLSRLSRLSRAIPDSSSDCADHFTKITAREMAICGGGFMGDSLITDAYGCRADQNYPPASSCPSGMQMINLYGFSDGWSTPIYNCYIPQNIGATSPPAGCPINQAIISCASGFVYDTTRSHLEWVGSGDVRGCSFACKAQPDPYASNSKWPCTKVGYSPIGGGSGDTCCAIW